ncbi:MAG TPA: hypothetical protein PKW95_16850 [bacterium]|nr:hypothetical protein [bacterium]
MAKRASTELNGAKIQQLLHACGLFWFCAGVMKLPPFRLCSGCQSGNTALRQSKEAGTSRPAGSWWP